MGGLTSAVHWWEESQLRVLVLSSMAVQFLLFIFSWLRRFAIPGWQRSITWLAYLASDAVAIYALATLFNRHMDQGGGGGSDSNITLEVVWAPVLLLHLGGHDGITAYNIEDNELWSRHLVTAVSQVTVAIYVFCKSWPSGGDKRLLAAAILLFIPGVVKCFVKPWALKNASIYRLVSAAAVEQNEGYMYPLEEFVTQAKDFVDRDQDCPPRHKEQGNTNVVDDVATTPASVEDEGHSPLQGLLCAQLLEPLRNYLRRFKRKQIIIGQVMLQEYRRVSQELGKLVDDDKEETWAVEVEDEGRFCAQLLHLINQQVGVRTAIRQRLRVLGEASDKLFVDLSSPYHRRLSLLEYFWGISEGRVYGYVQRGLVTAFLLLYTKLKTAGFLTGNEIGGGAVNRSDRVIFYCRQWILVTRLVLPLVSIGLFHRSHSYSHSKAHNNDGIDVKVTYALFCCTAVLEICSVLPVMLGDFASWADAFTSREKAGNRWPEVVAQYSLIRYFASNKKHSNWMCIAGIFGCKDFVDQRILYMKPCSSSARISRLVLGYLKDGWKKEIHDAPSYRRFNDHTTHWPVPLAHLKKGHLVGFSSMRKRPFDESVLLWHIATDICFFWIPAVSKHRCHFAEVRTSWKNRSNKQEQQHECRQELIPCRAVQCRQMSNYMAYLLFVNPEMLLPGTRRNLFTDAYDGLNDILRDIDMGRKPSNLEDDEWVTAGVIETMRKQRNRSKKASEPCSDEEEPKKVSPPEKESPPLCKQKSSQKRGGRSKEKLIDDAWALAQMLLDKSDEEMWEEIQRVWVEMLCFSASRCRGYLHAKALGEGGEFLSYVWLLLFYMGMETFTDKLQMQEPPSVPREAGNNVNVPPPSTSEISTDIVAPSTSEVHACSCTAPSTPSEICMAEDDMV